LYNTALKGADNMATTSVTIRMDVELKKQAERLFNDMGLNMTTAITVFAKAVVRKGKLPFEIAADPFYSEPNQTRLRETIEDYESGNAELIVKTMEELETMANG
jgi:DNA-damage-inducible protein J